jgi:isocitrate lyase
MFRRIALAAPRRVLIARTYVTATACRMSAIQPLRDPVSRPLASDSFQLLPEAEKAGAAEDALYEQQVKEVQTWWNSSRYEGIKRPYSAADVVSKRGSQQQSYPSSVMARKLFNLIKEREANGQPIHTSESLF